MNRTQVGITILRLGMAVVFMWFGVSQLVDGINWVSWVPEWAVEIIHLPPAMIVLGNGIFEVILGFLLAIGFKVRLVAAILALHMAVIVYSMGFTSIGIRDFGIAISSLSLALLSD